MVKFKHFSWNWKNKNEQSRHKFLKQTLNTLCLMHAFIKWVILCVKAWHISLNAQWVKNVWFNLSYLMVAKLISAFWGSVWQLIYTYSREHAWLLKYPDHLNIYQDPNQIRIFRWCLAHCFQVVILWLQSIIIESH